MKGRKNTRSFQVESAGTPQAFATQTIEFGRTKYDFNLELRPGWQLAESDFLKLRFIHWNPKRKWEMHLQQLSFRATQPLLTRRRTVFAESLDRRARKGKS